MRNGKKIGLDDQIHMLPPEEIILTVSILSEVYDYAHELMNIPHMWQSTMGEGVKVVVLDTGVAEHPDLKIAGEKDFTRSGATDRQGHGTHVAGIIGAIAHNGMGVAGVAPECELWNGKVLGDNGGGSLRGIIDGIMWGVDEVKADVINMSLGIPAGYAEVREMARACDYAREKGVVIIAAAGNEAGSVGQPASYASTMAIAAVDSKKRQASFSNSGPEVDFASAGVDVYSTYLRRSYARLSGTSMAAPQIAGVVALIISDWVKGKGEKPSVDDVYTAMKKIAYDVGPDGFDELYGHGIPVFRKHNDDPNKPEEPEKPVKPLPRCSWCRKYLRARKFMVGAWAQVCHA